MKRITLFTLALLCVSSFFQRGQAQLDKVKLKVGPVLAKTKTVAFAELEPVGHDNTGSYYILTPYSEVFKNAILTTRSYQVAHVSHDMVMDKVVPLDLKEGDKKMTFEFAFELEKTIYVFTSFQNHKIKKTFLFVQSINNKTLGLNDDLQPVAELDYAKEGKYKNASFDYVLSKDKSKLLITYNLLDRRGDILKSAFNVLDKNFNLISSQESTVPSRGGIFHFNNFTIDNEGNVFLLTRYFKDGKAYRDHAKWKKNHLLSNKRTYVTKANYVYEIIRYPRGERGLKTYTLSLPDRFITSIIFDVDKKGDLIGAGFTSDPNTTSINGTCFFRIDDSSEEIVTATSKVFDRNFILKGMSKKELKKALKKLNTGENFEDYRYVVQDIHFRENGGYTLMAEKLLEQTANIKQGNVVTVEHLYHMRDIVVVNFSADGAVEWVDKIEKNQELADRGFDYTSFTVSEFKNNLYFIFTNIDKSNTNVFGRFVRTKMNLVKIDGSGQQEQKVILGSEEDNVTLRAKDSQVLNDGIFNLYGQKNENRYGFIRLSLN